MTPWQQRIEELRNKVIEPQTVDDVPADCL